MKILIIGPRFNKKYPNIIGGAIILFEDMINQLDKYNVFILLSYKERCSSVIIKGLSLRISTIATTLPRIKEMIYDFHVAVLIEAGNVDQLRIVMEYFTEENYKIMSEKAYQKFDDFNSDVQTKLFLERLSDA